MYWAYIVTYNTFFWYQPGKLPNENLGSKTAWKEVEQIFSTQVYKRHDNRLQHKQTLDKQTSGLASQPS